MTGLGGQHAPIFQAIAGWDKAALDGSSALVLVRHGEAEEVQIPPESLRLLKTKGRIKVAVQRTRTLRS